MRHKMYKISTNCCCSLLHLVEPICIQLVIFGKKAQSAHIITFDFYFHQEHSKADLHSCHIHTVILFHSLSLYLYLFFLPLTLSFLLSFFFFFFCLSFLSSMSLSCHSIRRGCKGGADGFSLRRPCCGFPTAVGL